MGVEDMHLTTSKKKVKARTTKNLSGKVDISYPVSERNSTGGIRSSTNSRAIKNTRSSLECQMNSNASKINSIPDFNISAFKSVCNCQICGLSWRNPVELPCGHVFCKECLTCNQPSTSTGRTLAPELPVSCEVCLLKVTRRCVLIERDDLDEICKSFKILVQTIEDKFCPKTSRSNENDQNIVREQILEQNINSNDKSNVQVSNSLGDQGKIIKNKKQDKYENELKRKDDFSVETDIELPITSISRDVILSSRDEDEDMEKENKKNDPALKCLPQAVDPQCEKVHKVIALSFTPEDSRVLVADNCILNRIIDEEANKDQQSTSKNTSQTDAHAENIKDGINGSSNGNENYVNNEILDLSMQHDDRVQSSVKRYGFKIRKPIDLSKNSCYNEDDENSIEMLDIRFLRKRQHFVSNPKEEWKSFTGSNNKIMKFSDENANLTPTPPEIRKMITRAQNVDKVMNMNERNAEKFSDNDNDKFPDPVEKDFASMAFSDNTMFLDATRIVENLTPVRKAIQENANKFLRKNDQDLDLLPSLGENYNPATRRAESLNPAPAKQASGEIVNRTIEATEEELALLSCGNNNKDDGSSQLGAPKKSPNSANNLNNNNNGNGKVNFREKEKEFETQSFSDNTMFLEATRHVEDMISIEESFRNNNQLSKDLFDDDFLKVKEDSVHHNSPRPFENTLHDHISEVSDVNENNLLGQIIVGTKNNNYLKFNYDNIAASKSSDISNLVQPAAEINKAPVLEKRNEKQSIVKDNGIFVRPALKNKTHGLGSFVFCPTRLSKPQLTKLQQLCALIGGSICRDFTENVTHLILNLENERVPQTMKYLFAIAGKKWIVVFEWVEACLKHGGLVSEDPFETSNFPYCDPGVGISRKSQKQLFLNVTFYIAAHMTSSGASVNDCKKLLVQLGATVVNHPSETKEDIIIIGEHFDSTVNYQKWFKTRGWVSVSWEWVLDCVLSFSVLPFSQSHLITRVDGRNFESIQLPKPILAAQSSSQSN